jgi:DNA-binding IclR family transcriptional regulator
MSESGSTGIQVIARTAEILRILHTAPEGMTKAELGEQIGLPRSTVHRLLSAMRDEGLVESLDSHGSYRLGPAIQRMAGAAWRSIMARLHPLLEQLAREANETVSVSVLDRNRMTIAASINGSQRLRAVSMVGDTLPLHSTASGKAVLATMDAAGLARRLPGTLARATASTITDRAVLAKELALTAKRGYALDREENSEGICAVAIFLGVVAGVPAAVSVLQPALRFYGHEEAMAAKLTGWAESARTRLTP